MQEIVQIHLDICSIYTERYIYYRFTALWYGTVLRVPEGLFQIFKPFFDSLCHLLMTIQILLCTEIQ